MKVSVLLATYNGEKFLKEQIESLLSQTYSDFLIFINDDGSTDNTIEIINDYKSKYPNKIEILSLPQSKSPCKNFLSMLKEVKSDLYLFCDQDDVWVPEHVEILVIKYQSLAPSEKVLSVLIHSDLTVVDDNLNIKSKSFFKYQKMKKNPVKWQYYFVQNNVTGNTILINNPLKELAFKGIIESNIDKIPMHDWYLALIANLFGKIFFIDECLTIYRQHSNNQIGAHSFNDVRTYNLKLRKYFNNLNNVIVNTDLLNLVYDFYFNLLSTNQKKIIRIIINLYEKKSLKIKRQFYLIKYNFLKFNLKRKIIQILFA